MVRPEQPRLIKRVLQSPSAQFAGFLGVPAKSTGSATVLKQNGGVSPLSTTPGVIKIARSPEARLRLIRSLAVDAKPKSMLGLRKKRLLTSSEQPPRPRARRIKPRRPLLQLIKLESQPDELVELLRPINSNRLWMPITLRIRIH